jgi:hypothetical protein
MVVDVVNVSLCQKLFFSTASDYYYKMLCAKIIYNETWSLFESNKWISVVQWMAIAIAKYCVCVCVCVFMIQRTSKHHFGISFIVLKYLAFIWHLLILRKNPHQFLISKFCPWTEYFSSLFWILKLLIQTSFSVLTLGPRILEDPGKDLMTKNTLSIKGTNLKA